MKLLLLTLLLALCISPIFANKCDFCTKSVKAIKDGKGLAYMANLSAKQIDDYVKKHVEVSN